MDKNKSCFLQYIINLNELVSKWSRWKSKEDFYSLLSQCFFVTNYKKISLMTIIFYRHKIQDNMEYSYKLIISQILDYFDKLFVTNKSNVTDRLEYDHSSFE